MMRRILLLGLVVLMTACQQMGPTEYGVRFRRLPPLVGGGVKEKVIRPGETTYVLPMDSIFRFDTSVQSIAWGGVSRGREDASAQELVYTRALDGNEVALAVTVRYRISTDSSLLRNLVQEVATTNEEVRELVASVGRSEVRTQMNELRTPDFLDEKERYDAVDKVKVAMNSRFEPLGISILAVTLDDFRFERLLRDGSVDNDYQEKLTEIQRLREDTEKEVARIETVKAKKQQEMNVAQAGVNRLIAEADGYKRQATLRGDGYHAAKSNEALTISAQGKAEAEGMVEQIAALSGPGGEAILRLDVVRALAQSNAKFIVTGDGGAAGGGLELKRLDTNELLRQMGLIELMQDKPKPVVVNTERQSGADLKTHATKDTSGGQKP